MINIGNIPFYIRYNVQSSGYRGKGKWWVETLRGGRRDGLYTTFGTSRRSRSDVHPGSETRRSQTTIKVSESVGDLDIRKHHPES